ncbi:MAG: metal-dependent transcriptional regulator [Omnitrophica WOR_2 bacterium]
MMHQVFTHSVEDYLKTIYSIAGENGRATTNQLAERMGVKPASVTGMVQKMAMADPPLLLYHKHQGVELTPQGVKAALEIIRHHRLLELFLQQSLGYSWDKVHAEADRLEHVISEELEDRIAQVLGNPSHDPHGEPIPTRDLQLPASSVIPLSELRKGQEVIVERVDTIDQDMLRYLSTIGLVPGAQVRVLDYSPFDENIRLIIKGQADSMVLGQHITQHIFVNPVHTEL